MKALIVAAGKGSRLKNLTRNKPKPLIQLLGLSLIERVILTAKQAGIDDFVVVIGYLGDKIKEKLGNGEIYGVKISYIENKEWQRGNGVSVLKAKELLKENFFLLMSDHIFDAKILKELSQVKLKDGEGILVVDKKPKDYIDLDDATKVKVENGYIRKIGKKLKDYNGVDCGIFLLSPSIFKALEESIEKGDETLSGGVRILAKKRGMRSFDIKDNFWIDIDTKNSYRKAEKILCKKLIKPTDGPVSRHINRPVSTRISKLLVKTGIKPDLISSLSFAICLLSAFLFSFGDYLHIIVAGLLSQFSSIIDGCDGEVARLKFQQTNYGAWFDAVLDRYADAMIILGIVYGWWSLHGKVEVWIAGFIALIGSFMNSYTAIKYDAIFKKNKTGKIRFGRDVRLFLIMLGALLNQMYYILIILGILTNAESIRRLYILKNE
ncbi:NTP transferase domain-containing protein [Candidatus Aerophobetes bacterium]|nr:NTP transferase domain-containing protein [Candidatus Aerophobetes bacterium]